MWVNRCVFMTTWNSSTSSLVRDHRKLLTLFALERISPKIREKISPHLSNYDYRKVRGYIVSAIAAEERREKEVQQEIPMEVNRVRRERSTEESNEVQEE